MGEPALRSVLFVLGTRPEAIKLAPVISECSRQQIAHRVLLTNQHPILAPLALASFGLEATLSLPYAEGRSLATHLGTLMRGLDGITRDLQPSVVVVQGDTTSAAAGTLVAFLNRIPLLHVEAGLRTSSIADPFPEEAYRRIITICATFHCAPTIAASERLMSEGVPPHQIRVTGNTVIDSLANSLKRTVNPLPDRLDADSPFILLTAHRRDHSDRRATHIARAVKDILSRHRSLHVIAPLHPNGVAQQLGSELASENRVFLTAPLPYEQFIWCLQHCRAVVTDSGGVQEEAVALGVPTIVVRDSTERGEGIGHGINVVGLDPENIARAVDYTLRSTSTSRREALVDMTFGDGCASPRIVEEIAHLHQITRFNVAGEECRVF